MAVVGSASVAEVVEARVLETVAETLAEPGEEEVAGAAGPRHPDGPPATRRVRLSASSLASQRILMTPSPLGGSDREGLARSPKLLTSP